MLGGVCVNTGTIPSKTLREAVVYLTGMSQREMYGSSYRVKEKITPADLLARTQHVINKEQDVVRNQLMRNRVDLIQGHGRFVDPHTVLVEEPTRGEKTTVSGAHIVIATGTKPVRPAGVEFDEERVLDSDGILDLKSLPITMVVVGAGVIGIEYASMFAALGCKVTVVPATTSAEDILAMKPDGVFLSNGPGDPAATGKYAVPVIQKVIDSGTPTFGICLGHQMLGLAVGAKTKKMHQGHHGANHPVKDETTGKVEITSMNHGFAVDQATLPKGATQTHISLFDGSNCGIALDGKPVFSVQYHPEASPGPRDSHYLFDRFADLMRAKKK